MDSIYLPEKRTVSLYRDASTWEGEFLMRGAVCWPDFVERCGKKEYEGFIIIAGLNVNSKILTVFESRSFQTIENIIEGHEILYQGISSWMAKMWAKYYINMYYFSQSWELASKFRLEILRSVQIPNPKPQFIEVDIVTNKEARAALWRWKMMKKLDLGEEGTELHDAVLASRMEDDKAQPAIHALQCLVAGLEKYPYRG